MSNVHRWSIRQTLKEIGFFCPGVGTYWAVIRSGRSARIHKFLNTVFRLPPGHPSYEKFARGWTAEVEEKFGDQLKLYGGHKYITLREQPDRPGVVIEFIRKVPPTSLLEKFHAALEQEPVKPPKPKRKRKSRKKKTSPKGGAKASTVEAKTEKPEGDNAPEAQEKTDE